MLSAGKLRMASGAAGHLDYLDSQTVTTGTIGTALESDRLRGFVQGGIGAISDATSNIYGGAAITALYFDENGFSGLYVLTITGASNAGWTNLTIGSKVLARTSATFSTGTWTWTTADNVATQAFGTNGSIRGVFFD